MLLRLPSGTCSLTAWCRGCQQDCVSFAAGHERPPSARAAADAAQQQAGSEPASKQKHRRNRSLGSLGGILSLKSRGKDDKGKASPGPCLWNGHKGPLLPAPAWVLHSPEHSSLLGLIFPVHHKPCP